MEHFVSTFTNKIDAKGRVSVPASFRAVLAWEGFSGIYCYPSLDDPALDAGGQRLVDWNNALLAGVPDSPERDLLSMALYGASENISIDQDGRIIVPERLREHAHIDGQITFVGLGEKFQMWEPERFRARFEQGRRRLSELRKLLGAGSRSRGSFEGERE
ncbi:MAG: division/cell wall cluster transcriptional repressor MraZ [Methyloligellaceae bacterium]